VWLNCCSSPAPLGNESIVDKKASIIIDRTHKTTIVNLKDTLEQKISLKNFIKK